MALYCDVGQTARVTFPDGSIQDFPGPINVECTEQINDCTYISITTEWTRFDGRKFTRTDSRDSPWRYYLAPDGSRAGIYMSNCSGGQITGENFQLFVAGPPGSVIGLELVSTSYPFGDPSITHNLKIKNLNRDILYDSNFDNCNYLVECIEGCEENQLDCGDCCLPCDEVLDRICNIKNIFIGV